MTDTRNVLPWSSGKTWNETEAASFPQGVWHMTPQWSSGTRTPLWSSPLHSHQLSSHLALSLLYLVPSQCSEHQPTSPLAKRHRSSITLPKQWAATATVGHGQKPRQAGTDATINPSAGPTVALGISVTVSVYKPPKAWAVYRKSRLLTAVQRWELHLAKSLFIQFSSPAPKQAYCWGPGLCRALLTVPVFLGQCHEHSRVFGATTA